ncbi:alkylhydroperoxidase [Thioalkalivibrio denitrificans]|uniref:Alkylhydroperoxidase n=1 Tax=Thioalkalivibrio denitrificans TaxID=108003 RepID=A0A1V3NHF4_9GAMM|nr:carboxymuconolactone decarboxylase family protein [Thioalkalivibrio denitrificans]OOG24539.1 alkylhydroperoxidase [Thioalkalivibrio denitrificans]
MKSALIITASALAFTFIALISPAQSDEPPAFVQNTFPEQGVEAAWESYESVFLDPDAALDTRTKELMALAVAAQVPCDYCVYYHTRAAKAHGATDAEIREALAVASLIRKWSTMLNGSQYSESQWEREVDAIFSGQ